MFFLHQLLNGYESRDFEKHHHFVEVTSCSVRMKLECLPGQKQGNWEELGRHFSF